MVEGNLQGSNCFFFNDTATTEIYTLSLHDALPISGHHHIQQNQVRSTVLKLFQGLFATEGDRYF